jgi:hypothetical protein
MPGDLGQTRAEATTVMLVVALSPYSQGYSRAEG